MGSTEVTEHWASQLDGTGVSGWQYVGTARPPAAPRETPMADCDRHVVLAGKDLSAGSRGRRWPTVLGRLCRVTL